MFFYYKKNDAQIIFYYMERYQYNLSVKKHETNVKLYDHLIESCDKDESTFKNHNIIMRFNAGFVDCSSNTLFQIFKIFEIEKEYIDKFSMKIPCFFKYLNNGITIYFLLIKSGNFYKLYFRMIENDQIRDTIESFMDIYLSEFNQNDLIEYLKNYHEDVYNIFLLSTIC